MGHMKSLLLGLCGVVMATGVASATPSFNLVVSAGGVTHLAVGETLQLRVYQPLVHRDSAKLASPLTSPMKWRVEPESLASVNRDGLLTALQPGPLRILVEADQVPKGELPPGLPTTSSLTIVKSLPEGRLPRLDGVATFEGFRCEWDQSRHDGHGGRLHVALSTLAWSISITTELPPDKRLPWILGIVPERSMFNDDKGYRELLGTADYERWQANITSARVTVSSWKDGIASGRLEATTTRGVKIDTTFRAWMEDQDGALARATSPVPPPQR